MDPRRPARPAPTTRTTFAARIALGATLALLLGGTALPPFPALASGSQDPSGTVGTELVAGIWDSHPDPDVGRVFVPGLVDAPYDLTTLTTNRWGLREVEFEPKPPGTVRVLVVGDSYVAGLGVAPEDRFGNFLETYLEEHAEREVDVEVLHIAVASWNLRAQCAFTRRTLGVLEPDLVIHFPNRNDLGDMRGTRGFGELAGESPQVIQRGTGLVQTSVRLKEGAPGIGNHLPYGLCWESRTRYERAVADLQQLAHAVRATGARYLMVSSWTGFQPLVLRYFKPALRKNEWALFSNIFLVDPGTWVAETERHWNPDMHAHVAHVLYGLVQQRDLLPSLTLRSWSEADTWVEEVHGHALKEARRRKRFDEKIAGLDLSREIDFLQLETRTIQQIYGGVRQSAIDPNLVLAAPYVSLLFPGGDVRELVVRGRRAGRPELRGRTRVYVEEFEVGSWELAGATDLEERFPLPEGVIGREFLNVRLVSDDFLYAWAQECGSFALTSVAVH